MSAGFLVRTTGGMVVPFPEIKKKKERKKTQKGKLGEKKQ